MPIIRDGDQRFQDFSELMELVTRNDNMLEKMGIFDKDYLTGTLGSFERRVNGDDAMYSVARDADRQFAGDDKAITAHVEVPFFTLDKTTRPSDGQDLREFGTAIEPVTYQKRIDRIIARIQRGHAVLHRKAMYGCLKGSTYAPDPAGVPRPSLTRTYQSMFEIANVDMYNGTAGGTATIAISDQTLNPADEFEKFRQHVIAKAGDNGDDYEIVALMGSGAFTALKNHADYVEAFANYASEVEPLRQRLGGLKNSRVLEWQGVTYIEDISGEVANTQILMFPKGMDDMFQIKYAPANTEDHMNQVAEEAYLFLLKGERRTTVETETSLVCVNTRPDLVANYTATL